VRNFIATELFCYHINLYSLLVYIEYNGDELPKDYTNTAFFRILSSSSFVTLPTNDIIQSKILTTSCNKSHITREKIETSK
jgi:hypothetical protein